MLHAAGTWLRGGVDERREHGRDARVGRVLPWDASYRGADPVGLLAPR